MDDKQQLSRRELLQRAGASGLAVAAAGLAGPLIVPAAAVRAGAATQGIDERPAITAVVDQYFKTKYESRRLLQVQDFSGLTTGSGKSQAFIQAERDKREVELFQAEIFGLRYAKYNYFLDFANLQVDAAGKAAAITATEGCDVVFESTAPVVTKIRNIKHTITLEESGGSWRIVTDEYADDLQPVLKARGKDKLKEQMRKNKQDGLRRPASLDTGNPQQPNDQMSALAGNWYPYNRSEARRYAEVYAYSRNDASTGGPYYDFPDNDCTNFISQCIRNSGPAGMDPEGSYAWYYYSTDNYSRSWTFVQDLYDYLLRNPPGGPWTGPVGVACWTDSLDIADLVQLDFGYAAGYQHCPIVTTKYGTEGNQIFCAAHSSDCFDRPLNDFPAYTNIRFAHLTGYYD